MSKVQLTISMLVCGRDTTIRCLDSLKPILEGMSSELILVDTGCDAALREKLSEYTDQILSFQWCDDFSAARNVGVKAAHGEWFLYIDDDEWFINPEVLIQFFKSGEYKKYGCINYIQRNYYDADFVHYDDFWVSRMIRLEHDTEFKSKIHEYLYPIRGEAYNLPLIAKHTGYVFQTQEDRKRHYDRNAPLILQMIEEEPERLRWRVQMMQEYRSIKEYTKMYDFGMECLEYTQKNNSKLDNYDIGTFYAGAAEGKLFLKDYETAWAVTERGLKDPRMNEMCHAYMYLCRGTIAFHEGKWAEAENNIHAYFRVKKELVKNEARYANQKSSLLVGEAFDVFPTQRALSILCACELRRGDSSKLKKYISQMDWDKKRVYQFEGFMSALVDCLGNLPMKPEFVEVAQMAWDNEVIQPKFFYEVQMWEERDREKFLRLLRIVAKINGPQWYLRYARILVADAEGNREPMEVAFAEFLESTANVFLTPENITEIMKKYRIPIEKYYLAVEFDKWRQHLEDFLEHSAYQDILLKKYEFSLMKTTDNVRYDYLETRLAELDVLYSVHEDEFAKKRQTLAFFAERALEFLGKYYQNKVFEEMTELLPKYGQAAVLIQRALDLEAENIKDALGTYAEVAAVCPEWAEAVKSYMQALGEEQERKAKAAKDEMEQLEAKILAEVHKCVQEQRYPDAMVIIEQLKQMKPNDLDIAELALRTRLAMIEAQ